MKNNLTITALFLLFSCFVFGQEVTINNLGIDSRKNGTLINIGSTKKINLEDVTAWYSSEWFYLTVYNAKTDSTKLVGQELGGSITKIEIANNEESTQIALKLRKEIESFEITNPTRKNISFLLRLSQEESKKSITMDEEIQIFAEKNNDDMKKSRNLDKKDSSIQKIDRTMELSILGAIVAVSDITNPGTFLLGAIIALSTVFF
ncbi:MAG TPA: hypothetical protein QGF75_03265 [Candidatus Marinimicrobia bacterium]|nr:hypothetical protein [Candidatus Neomarinimicrobiota bacterium]